MFRTCVFSFLLVLLAVTSVSAEAPAYTVLRKSASATIMPDSSQSEANWTAATAFSKFSFPWGYADSTELTTVKMLWDDTFLYIYFYCTDKYLTAKTYNTVGSYSDSTGDDYVQFLWNPNPSAGNKYNIFEFNCVGCPHAMYNDLEHDFLLRDYRIMPPHIAQVVLGTVNSDTATDTAWRLEVAIRFSDYPELFSGTTPQAGDTWKIALNRVSYGGGRSVQYSQWSPSSSSTAGDIMRPGDFGTITFSSTAVQ